MLTFSALQMRRLGDGMRRKFEQDSVALLRREFPKTTAPHSDELLLRFVALGIDRAGQNGLVAVTDVERWLRLMVRLGPDFDSDERYKSLQSILVRSGVYGPLRLEEAEALAATLAEHPG